MSRTRPGFLDLIARRPSAHKMKPSRQQIWVSANKRQNLCFAAKEVENQGSQKGAVNLCRPAEEVRKKPKPLPRILSTAAFELREKAEKRETERRTEEEFAQQHRLAEARVRRLNDHLEVWTKAEALHRLIAHVERKMESEAPADSAYARGWLDWARTEAITLDPASGSLDEFFDHYRAIDRPTLPNDFDDDL
jgi:hypothetical protein